jgi:glycosyltransferase involved in cell wall biosynthesis
MACGAPVVTSRLSSLPEVVGDAAVFVDPWSTSDIADGLERALTDEPLRAELRRKGLERVKSFSWDRSVKAIHEGYLKALGRPVTAVAAEPAR